MNKIKKTQIKIVTLGYGNFLINKLWAPVQEQVNWDIWHIIHPSYNNRLNNKKISDLFEKRVIYISEKIPKNLPETDFAYLNFLDSITNFGIRNCIEADVILSKLDYDKALRYLSFIAKRIKKSLIKIKPLLIISGFEGFHSSLTHIICKELKINWYGVVYAPFPKGYCGFSSSLNSLKTKSYKTLSNKNINKLVEKTLDNYYLNKLKTDISKDIERDFISFLKLIPKRFKNFKGNILRYFNGFQNKYIHRTLTNSIKDYIKSRINQFINLFFHKEKQPNTKKKFFFYGIHMQPEMSMEVWSTYLSDQVNIINNIAKSLPPNFDFYVKLHPLDAFSWNFNKLRSLRNIPSLKLVSNTADSRIFIENAEIVFSIQGTIGYEAALLCKKVVTFGENMIEDFDNVYRIKDFNKLKHFINYVLNEPNPTKTQVKKGLFKYLSRLNPGPHNNWDKDPDKEQIEAFSSSLNYLVNSIRN